MVILHTHCKVRHGIYTPIRPNCVQVVTGAIDSSEYKVGTNLTVIPMGQADPNTKYDEPVHGCTERPISKTCGKPHSSVPAFPEITERAEDLVENNKKKKKKHQSPERPQDTNRYKNLHIKNKFITLQIRIPFSSLLKFRLTDMRK